MIYGRQLSGYFDSFSFVCFVSCADAAIEIGFVGDNIDTLVALTQRAQEIARKNDMVMEVRNSWGNKVPVWKPLYSQEKGLRLGITRQQMAYSLRSATNGVPLGEYREGDATGGVPGS